MCWGGKGLGLSPSPWFCLGAMTITLWGAGTIHLPPYTHGYTSQAPVRLLCHRTGALYLAPRYAFSPWFRGFSLLCTIRPVFRRRGQRATPRGLALGHIVIAYDRVLGARAQKKELMPILNIKWVFTILLWIFY
jgi:hypothetical protein